MGKWTTGLHRFINENGLGIVADSGSVSVIGQAIQKAIEMHDSKHFVKADIANLAERHFGKKVVLQKFSEAFSECTN
jgi:hypothetical protein